MPYGTGSIQMRGNCWWLMYRDTEGRTIQENSRTADQNAARRMLAERAIVTLEARLAVLRAVLHETREAKIQGDGGARRGDARKRAAADRGAEGNAANRQRGSKGGTR